MPRGRKPVARLCRSATGCGNLDALSARREAYRTAPVLREMKPAKLTLDDRLDAIWAKFEAEMAECKRLQDISRAIWKTRDDRHKRDQAAD